MSEIISIFDTSISTYNLGNKIIMDAVMDNLDELYPNDFLIRLPIEDIGRIARRYNSKSKYTFVGGTNVLNCDIRKYRQWDLTLHNILILRRVVLMGCGWWKYENKPISVFTKWVLSKILSHNVIHSVRDSYTLQRCEELSGLGLKFINTGCPTLWNLTEDVTSKIPKNKSNRIVFTITDYSPNEKRDVTFVKQLKDLYTEVFFFPQGTGDISYLSKLDLINGIKILPPRLQAFTSLLESGADYVGTRLHAGIRALQKSKRSIIIGIDNRALEMGKDFGIPVLPQENITNLTDTINKSYSIHLNLPWDNIKIWKEQFQ